MAETFPDISIGEGSTKDGGYRILEADFGDGYSQTAIDGLNPVEEEWDLVFEKYPIADVKTIIDFLDERKGNEWFWWKAPDDVQNKKWKQVGKYNLGFDGPLTRTLRFKIKRIYDT